MTTPAARILSPEDDSDTRDLIQFVLEREGFEVVYADDAEHAVTLARAGKFHLYLLDTWTPDVIGADVCRSLRELDQTTPILFYSGASSDADRTAAIKARAQGYVVKPSNPDILLREIVGLLDRN
jgi:DNA-binding response OmpR family regulator